MSDHLTKSPRLLLVSREPAGVYPLRQLAEANHWLLDTARSGWEALERVHSGAASDVVVLEVAHDDRDGLHTLRWLRRVRPDLPILVLTHSEDGGQKLEATRLGAQEYLVQPVGERQLKMVIERYLPVGCDDGENETDTEGIEQVAEDVFFIAASPTMRKLRAQAELLAQVNAPVLIVGESGSGKELVARLIHKLSVRSGFRFVKVDCKLLPGDLLEGELFGHDGAFAVNGRNRLNKFELSQKGTLFLDEITEMPSSVQAKLLHALQEGHSGQPGGQNGGEIDVRILAATNINLERVVAENKLREDLYYQLSAFIVHVPPLRQREDEIPLLMGHFMKQLAKHYSLPPRGLSPALLEACRSYSWPGNLRELENFVKCYLVMGDEEFALAELQRNWETRSESAPVPGAWGSLPSPREENAEIGSSASGLKSLVQNAKGATERNAIATALSKTHWNRKAAARLLKVSYRTMLYKIEHYHMSPPASPTPGYGNGSGLKRNGQGR